MRVYISGSTRTQDKIIKETAEILRKDGHIPSYHMDGHLYSKNNLEKSDAVVFILPSNSWSYPIHKLTQGVLKELVFCLNHRKDIFISYRAQNGLKVYAAEIDEDLCIKGISATYLNLGVLDELKIDKSKADKPLVSSKSVGTARFY